MLDEKKGGGLLKEASVREEWTLHMVIKKTKD